MPGNFQQQTLAHYMDDAPFTIEGEAKMVGKLLDYLMF